MRRFSLSLATTLCFLVVVHACALTVAAKDTWISVRTNNFHLVGNASEKDIKAVGTRLEQFRDVFSRLFPGLRLSSPVPTTVVVFKSDQSYKPFKPVIDGKISEVGGYFQAGNEVNYITLTTAKRAENPYGIIFHEYVHLLIKNTMGRARVPPWFNEGLAEYYSTFDIEGDRRVFLGRPHFNHLELLKKSRLLPLKTLFSVDYDSLIRNHATRGQFYAQSWALVHYFIHGDEEDRVSRLQQFVNLLLGKTEIEDAYQKVFNSDFEALAKELRSYIQKKSFRINIATFGKKLEFDSEFETSGLSEGQAEAYLGDLLYNINRLDDAAIRLEQALALDPNISMAHASLGMVRLKQKDFVGAKQHLQKALELDSGNYLAHYYYSYLLSREYMTEGDLVSDFPEAPTEAMRKNLRRSIELKPDFPESYRLLAFINLVRGEQLDESVELIKKAITFSPANEAYLFVLAQLHLRKHDFDAAREIIGPLAVSSADPSIRETAQLLQGSMASIQAQLEAVRQAKERAARARGEASSSPDLTPVEMTETRPPDDPSAQLEAALKRPADGQIRLQGLLTRIDCGAQGIFFTVRVGERLLRLRAGDFEEVFIRTFAESVRGEITCGVRKPQDPVVILYLPVKDRKARSDGAIVSIEFVPGDFKLSQAR